MSEEQPTNETVKPEKKPTAMHLTPAAKCKLEKLADWDDRTMSAVVERLIHAEYGERTAAPEAPKVKG